MIFAFHGYPRLVHQLTYARRNHDQMHVHSYQENGTTTTPFDMVVLNDLDRFSLAIDVIDATLGGFDVLVLTGGIGEHSPEVRTGLIERLSWLGVGDTTPLLVIAAHEDLQIAGETSQLLDR